MQLPKPAPIPAARGMGSLYAKRKVLVGMDICKEGPFCEMEVLGNGYLAGKNNCNTIVWEVGTMAQGRKVSIDVAAFV